MKLARTALVIAAATAFAIPATPAFADSNTQTPNRSAQFGQSGSAEDKLDLVNNSQIFDFEVDYDQVGAFMSDHVRDDVYADFPGRSGLAPNSRNANSNATD